MSWQSVLRWLWRRRHEERDADRQRRVIEDHEARLRALQARVAVQQARLRERERGEYGRHR